MNSRGNKQLTEKQFRRWQKAMKIGYKVFKCHQLPDRSFHWHGLQFPICARCTGIFLGFILLGPIITIFTFGNMYFSLGLVGLMCLDGFLQLFNILKSDNIRRLVTGLGFGYALFSFIVHIIVKIIYLSTL